MVITTFNGAGVGFGFGVGCGFGIGWGFGGMPLNLLGLGAGTIVMNLLSLLFLSFNFQYSMVMTCCMIWVAFFTKTLILQVTPKDFFFKGGGCGVGVGLGWGFGTAFGSKYRSSRITFQGMEFDSKETGNSKEFSKPSTEAGGAR